MLAGQPAPTDAPAAHRTVTVAIPVKNGGELLSEVLAAVRGQRLEPGQTLEVLVCDSGSTDGSVQRARREGATVFSIPSDEFSHGGTRNLLMSRARGDHVAFLTQDAIPAATTWLGELLTGFSAADDVGLVFGPYLPRSDASLPVRRELEGWFASLAPDGAPRVDRLAVEERQLSAARIYGRRSFFTDANACISRVAWERVPFRQVAYAEDHALAQDMLRAGFAKVFMPGAGVVHSHDYGGWGWLRRSFDEARAVSEIYQLDEPARLRELLLSVRGGFVGDLRYGWRDRTAPGASRALLPLHSLRYHLARALGSGLGARSERLPDWVVSRLSLEGRA